MPNGKDKQPDFIPASAPDFIPASSTSGAAPELPPSPDSSLMSGAADIGTGVLKGALHTLGGLSPLLNKIPYVGEYLAPTAGVKALEQITKPEGNLQKGGYYGEQVGEYLIPGPAEDKAAAEIAEHMPVLGKLAAPVARIGTSALSTGALNKLQGGSFEGGAAMGAGMGGVGEVARALAPSVAESALGITKRMRGYGRTPGEAALDEIKGIRPETIEVNAQSKAGELTKEMEQKIAASKIPVSTDSAKDLLLKEAGKASKQNNDVLHGQIMDVYNRLTKNVITGQQFPAQMSASDLLDLKRGIGNTVKTWNPEAQRSGITPILRRVYSALDKELDRAAPETAGINQRISSLIPVAERAESTSREAGIGQRVAHRMAAHTGALAGAGLGAGLGYERGGTPGALAGGALGLVVPEVLSSPSAEMLGARALRSSVLPRIASGVGAQLLDRSEESENPRKKNGGG